MNNTNTVTLDLHEYNKMKEFNESMKKNGMAVERQMGYVVREYYGENEAIKKLQMELEQSIEIEKVIRKQLRETIELNESKSSKSESLLLLKVISFTAIGITCGIIFGHCITKLLN